ncbi:MAG: hypothetical protein JWQ57_690 [Mucilaginibacter sp.]|nr:hypothetical protein [Mucilaginibacter sp.]
MLYYIDNWYINLTIKILVYNSFYEKNNINRLAVSCLSQGQA